MEDQEKKKKKVMVAIDQSEYSRYALEWALENLHDSIANNHLLIFTVQPISDYSYLQASAYGATLKEMSGATGDDTASHLTKEMQEKISKAVGKALEASLPQLIDRLQTTISSVVEEKINELKESLMQERDKGKTKACPYNEFMACKPPIYNGEVDPIVCQRWISDIEGVFERTHCDETDFVAYGIGQLRGQARDWWDNLKKEQGIEATRTMTWEEFKVPFLRHHSPEAMINKIIEEFIQLRQKGESIDKITGVFLEKLRFCDELVQTEEQKIYYYNNMLSVEYREFMTPSKYGHLTEIINAAREREIELKRQIERGERRALDANPSPTKKQRPNETPKKGNTKGGSPQCKTCGKPHRGECYFKNKPCPTCGKVGHVASNCPGKVSVCYKCYKPGHKMSECPELIGNKETTDTKTEAPRSKARSFHITAAEAKVEPDVVSAPELIRNIQENQKKVALNLLDQAKDLCNKYGITAETMTEVGDPKELIYEAVEKLKVQLLVLGSSSRGFLKRAFLGSVSNHCVQNVKCPVLVVKKTV
ncbi:putative transcription factor interactor and regulator CCHC(Zn) family [Helianthus annuus]|uniref:uncharacterized protein LOC110920920 n=1 Tax=Helianthus annuus TaxID=4232 RepID=UPI000B8F0CDA|nr:uncharacterized protein LOC110920920 [Helianthus annuus]KAJ0430866.1 putative transcription factor interactor and regulator CCHC(Zn) family [Helianthus annuus]KAJ0449322.1 putative transcription factor interactor and regulator CCHC(Zn) family [Helianthus annuus]KAJ0828507.1 putative transcription factor interactor and regulator CCHC(Zn) family [Helianthus annuus]